MSASVDKDYKVKTELLERSAASKRQLPPIMCSLPSHLNLPPGCEVYVYGSELPADAPLCLCLGEGAPSCCAAGARTLHMPLPRSQGSSGAHVMAGARAVLRELFRRAREQHAKGVYLVGEGIGALFIAKLLADKQLFDECPSAHLLQGAILISGIYDLHDGSALDHIKRVTNQNCISKMNAKQTLSNGSPPQNSLIQNLVDNHQSFVDRNNLSFICDLSNRCTQFDSSFSCNTKKIKPVHGIQLTPEETLKMSPIFQTIAQNEDVNANCKTDRSDNCSVDFDRLSSSMEEIEMMKLLAGEPRDFYPLFEDFTHLRTIAMGVHIIACELDGASITKQSRDMFDRLSNGVDQDDMHFQVKDKVNRSDVRVLLTQNDNFLKRLLRYDIVKYMS